jgi:uncharacterized protein YbjT (DUF2867 family)
VVTALVVGATGLVGSHLVRILAADPHYSTVRVLARRPLHEPPAGVESVILSFENLLDHAARLRADHVFCALGTTRKKAGSAERFRQVDLEYPRQVAALTRDHGARHFTLISSIGARPGSPFLYTRTKGEAEAAVRAAGFPGGTILRPSVLGGQRDERRPLETIAQLLGRLAPPRWRTVDAADVARAAVRLAREESMGWRVVESHEIPRIARADFDS